MALRFACRACGATHPSRIRAADEGVALVMMRAFGQVLEPCPATGRWTVVRAGDVSWDGPGFSRRANGDIV